MRIFLDFPPSIEPLGAGFACWEFLAGQTEPTADEEEEDDDVDELDQWTFNDLETLVEVFKREQDDPNKTSKYKLQDIDLDVSEMNDEGSAGPIGLLGWDYGSIWDWNRFWDK